MCSVNLSVARARHTVLISVYANVMTSVQIYSLKRKHLSPEIVKS